MTNTTNATTPQRPRSTALGNKALRLLLAAVMALSGLLCLTHTRTAYADEATIQVSSDAYDFMQYDSNTGSHWHDTFLYINDEPVMCIDVTMGVVNGESYQSQDMPADAALQIGLYDKFLSEAYPDWSDAKHYGYLQYMIWLVYSPSYMEAYVTPDNSDFWDVYASAQEYYQENKSAYEAWGTEWHSSNSQSVCIIPHLTEIKGGVRIEKADLELGKSEALGGASHSSTIGPNLSNIGFTITNRNNRAVTVGGVSYEPGAQIETIYTTWDEELAAYVASTAADELPGGTYEIQETSTNETYLLTDGQPCTFQIRENGSIVTTDTSGNALVFEDQVVRNDLELSKTAGDSGKAIQAAFLITNVTTGEAHVLVCDRNGDASTAASWNAHTYNTNDNDALANAEALNAADFDTEAGIWFGLGEDGSWAEPNDTLAALPYGHYTLTELRSDSNQGYELITRDFWITRDNTIARATWMSLDDQTIPETPDEPETPETPDEPDTPDTPDEPETPETPETPNTPTSPYDKTGVVLPEEAAIPVCAGFGAVACAIVAFVLATRRPGHKVKEDESDE